MQQYQPIAKTKRILHGADYNPDQWLHMPNVIDEDFRLMKLARIGIVNLGIFAWAALEPEEGRYEFSWLDDIMNRLGEAGIRVCLATPSAARPAWLDAAYPEVIRTEANRVRNLHGGRHNHNFSSPIFRQKVSEMNTRLAERYKDHEALAVWHISNEYSGADHSELSQRAFRDWLKLRYNNDLDTLNRAWWTAFWSRTYTSWDQIESPAPHGETSVHGLVLDWKRFTTQQTIDFMRTEIEPLRKITPKVPITTNFMGAFPGLDYFKFRDVLDVASWDSYPTWHFEDPTVDDGLSDFRRAADTAFQHDLIRSIKGGKPFMLMESTPTTTNWHRVGMLKRPGMHIISSLLAVAHGADTVEYFQWRKSRGATEKFHGAVVDHAGHEHTRAFGEVARLGAILEKLDEVVGTGVPARCAVVFDWENRWAQEEARGPRNDEYKDYLSECMRHYRPLWTRGVACDVIDSECSFEPYDLIIAPKLYMVKPGVADRLAAFVAAGGILVTTYWSGIVDESDLCFLGGFPGPLRELLGVWSEEIDCLPEGRLNSIRCAGSNDLGLAGEFEAGIYCDLIHTESAETLATYTDDFYAGRPALTRNRFGDGYAFYVAAQMEDRFLKEFYGALVEYTGVTRAFETTLPPGVSASVREGESARYVFLLNFTAEQKRIELPETAGVDLLTGRPCGGPTTIGERGFLVLRA